MAASKLGNHDRISTAVVEALADANDVDPLELDPLYEAVDPDALDSLFSTSDGSTGIPHGTVRFTTNGYEVEVTSTGRVHLTPEESVEAVS
ncbi:HalOD1 output domain-containing protein [Natranaeroarchaeum aerophilus]|uniref:Halobacterial output domain-containing protein n=1 Tax=Natranaeroarchaeum aerophilus TaxID=2917711 RepID=A0AAE3FSQ1_9EURY|nr:HalOD1 output domain-containing protein [Natranaeroarchaeum aerophilus]MCL9813859.1 hypothetical protein [Natranaeroarchaeum aerophilus]